MRCWSKPTFFFFFQAEDGIRDKLVTGVQTCALPISIVRSAPRIPAPDRLWYKESCQSCRRRNPDIAGGVGAVPERGPAGRERWLERSRMAGVSWSKRRSALVKRAYKLRERPRRTLPARRPRLAGP